MNLRRPIAQCFKRTLFRGDLTHLPCEGFAAAPNPTDAGNVAAAGAVYNAQVEAQARDLGNVLTSVNSASCLFFDRNESWVIEAAQRDRRSVGPSTAGLTTVGASPSSLPFVFIDESTSSSAGGSTIFDERGGSISLNVSSDQTERLRRDLQRFD